MPRVPAEPVPGVGGLELVSLGHRGKGDVYRGDAGGTPVIVKDYRAKPLAVRVLWGRPTIRRERRAYAQLQGLRGIARLLPQGGPLVLVVQCIAGEALSARPPGSVAAATFARLGALVGELHARGIVHLDLNHRGNILVSADGTPWLIDLASVVDFSRFGGPGRWLARRVGFFDRAAVAKWKAQLGAEPLSPAEARDLRWLMRLKGLWVLNPK